MVSLINPFSLYKAFHASLSHNSIITQPCIPLPSPPPRICGFIISKTEQVGAGTGVFHMAEEEKLYDGDMARGYGKTL